MSIKPPKAGGDTHGTLHTPSAPPKKKKDYAGLLKDALEDLRDMVKPLWDAGDRTNSKICEVNIMKGEDALASGDPKEIRDKYHLVRITIEVNQKSLKI